MKRKSNNSFRLPPSLHNIKYSRNNYISAKVLVDSYYSTAAGSLFSCPAPAPPGSPVPQQGATPTFHAKIFKFSHFLSKFIIAEKNKVDGMKLYF